MAKTPKSPRILILDDDTSYCRLAARLLEYEGYSCKEVFDGQEALEEVGKFKPDLLLLDIHLPEQSGIEIFEMMGRDSATAKIPVILLTGLHVIDDVLDQIPSELKPSAIHRKYLGIEDLVKKIKRIIKP